MCSWHCDTWGKAGEACMQDAADEAAAAAAAASHKPVRKSEAHQRLKECNRQRRSLAGGVAFCVQMTGDTS